MNTRQKTLIILLRIRRNKNNIDLIIIKKLFKMLYEHNTHAKSFQMKREKLNEANVHYLKLLISNRNTYGRIYNQPTILEVVALIVADIYMTYERDIIM